MRRAFKYRLQPTPAQAARLDRWRRGCCTLYNAALQERRDAWRKQRVSVSLYDQDAQVTEVRADDPDFAAVPRIFLSGTLRRLDRAFKAFFRRCKAGEKAGYPRFRSARRFLTLAIDDPRDVRIVAGGQRVRIPLLGKVKFRQHRPVEGRPRTMRLTMDAGGRWFVIFCCDEVPAKPLPSTDREVGVDVGLSIFAATSDGEMFDNPRPARAARIRLERAQRRVCRRKRGSNRRRKAVRLLARAHEHVANLRREHHINVSRSLVGYYDTIYVEKLSVKGMAFGTIAMPIRDAAWSSFLRWLRVKAESAGREVVEVDPRGTSQQCSRCGVEVRKGLAVRVHRCPSCGLVVDRDVNAACNILKLGRSLRGAAPLVEGRLRSAEVAA